MKHPLFSLIAIVFLLILPAKAQQASDFAGQPKFEKGGNLGYFVWKDGDTWKVRWTTFGRMRQFTGSVVAEGGKIKSLKRIDVETVRRVIQSGKGPRVVRQPGGRLATIPGRDTVIVERQQDRIERVKDGEIQFIARTNDDIDGFDFKVADDVSALKFFLEIDGIPRAEFVNIGADARRPADNPFVVALK